MKKVFVLLLSCNFLFTQTINNDFLDGTIIFKLKEFIENDDNNLDTCLLYTSPSPRD